MQAEQRWNSIRGRVKYQLARQQYEAGLLIECTGTVAEAISLEPFHADAYILLARANLDLGKPATAQEALEVARRAGFNSADLLYTEGVILEQRGRIEAALAKYTPACELETGNVDYLVARAECLVALGRAEEARAFLKDRADGVDDAGTVAALSAHIALLLGNQEEAARAFGDALIAAGDSAMVAEAFGLLLVRMGRYAEALSLLRPLVENPSALHATGAVRRGLARCYLALRDPTSAKATLTEYAGAHPEDAPAQLLLAKAAIASGDLWTAVRAVDMAEQRGPYNPEVAFVRAVIDWKDGEYAAAERWLTGVLERNPGDVDARSLLGEVLAVQGKDQAANELFRDKR